MRRMALAFVLLLLLPSCEDSEVITQTPAVDESKSYIGTLSPTSWTVTAGDAVGLYATVVNPLNTPLPDRVVSFEIVQGPGSLSADSLVTDENGAVQTMLLTQEDEYGLSVVRALTGESHKDIIIQVLEPVDPGEGGGAAQIDLSADPSSVIGNGHSVSVITAYVTDRLGAPVPDGTEVKFAAGEKFVDVDGDGYFTTGVDSLVVDADGDGQWDAIGSIDATATTVSGTAVVSYSAPEDTGTVYVKATAGKATQDLVVAIVPPPPELNLASIELVAASPSLQVKSTGGVEATTITAYCYDALGSPVGAGWEVEFEVLYGPGGGEGLEGQGYGPLTFYTDEEGTASVSATSGTVSGTMYVRARSGDVYSDAAKIGISAGPPVYISLAVDPGNIRGWDIAHVPAAVTALVGDLYHNPVPDGTAVYFTAEEGTIVGADDSGVAYTYGGFANATFYSGEPRNDGVVEITASTMGGNVTAQTALITSGPPAIIEFLSYPASLPASPSADGKVIVKVLDVNGNYVVNGTVVRFETDYGSITPTATTSDGLYNSVAEATLYSEILNADNSMPGPTDDGVGAVATLTAGSALAYGASTSVTVQLTTSVARSDRSFATLPEKIPPSSTVPIMVTIKDREGNPLGDHPLTFSVTAGSIDPLAVTDSMGEAQVYFAAPDTAAEVMMTVQDTDPNYGGVIMFETLTVQ